MRPWVYLPGGIIPAAYRTYKKIYEEFPEQVKHPRLSAMKKALVTECTRDAIPLFLTGMYLLTPDSYGIFGKAMVVFIGGQVYLGASAGADSGFNYENLIKRKEARQDGYSGELNGTL